MKAIHEHTRNPSTDHHLTRRAALASTAALSAAVLPVGAAEALPVVAADPGLAAIEAGYRRYQEIHAERDRLDQIADELRDRADQAIAPMLLPKPPIPPELAPYARWNEAMGQEIVWRGTTPRKGKVGKIADAYFRAEIEWRGAHNELLEGQPDYKRAGEIDADRDALLDATAEVRRQVLAIPTTSPRGLLIKLAIAMEAKTLDGMDVRLADPDGLHDDWASDGLPGIAADLRAMAAEG